MTDQFRFTDAQRAAFRADPPGYAVGAADRVLTDIERIIGRGGVGAVEEFAFSDEDRAAVRAVFAKKDVVSTSDTWEALTNAVEAAIRRARAGDRVGTIRRSPDGYRRGVTAYAIKTERRWILVESSGDSLTAADSSLLVPQLHNWPRIYPEADS